MRAILRQLFWRAASVLLPPFLCLQVLYSAVGNDCLDQYPYHPFPGRVCVHNSSLPQNLSRGSFRLFWLLPVTQRSINFLPYSLSLPVQSGAFIEFFLLLRPLKRSPRRGR